MTKNDGKNNDNSMFEALMCLLESYLKVHSCARDHSCAQTKFHVDPCRDSQDYPGQKMQTDGWTDRWTDGFSALYSRR